MEQHRFDDLTRAAAHRGSRRGFLRGLIGAAAASLGLGAFGQDTAAQGDCEGLTCPDDYCSPKLTITGECACYQHGVPQICRTDGCYTDGDCGEVALCFHYDTCGDGFPGHCIQQCGVFKSACDDGLAMCDGACIDVMSDKMNCGTCGNVCNLVGGISHDENACVEGQCTTVCGADLCGDECVDLNMSFRHCGACGSQCAEGEMCCGGRCFNPDHYERFCDWCGYQGGFPQGCNAEEVCDRGLCVPVAIQQEEPEPTETEEAAETSPSAVLATGQLAYAIRDGQHWSVWTHDLVTGGNVLLADEPGSDQFAPAWSHDGTRVAYLSDQAGAVNQVWLHDATGTQRQLSDYAGTGDLVHVAWSWDDAAIVVTEAGADGSNRLLALPPDGGSLSAYTDTLGGWPSFGAGDRMAFVGEGDLGMPGIMLQAGPDLRWDVIPDSILGDEYMVGEPCLTKRGTDLALSIGQPGERRVVAFGPYTDRPVPDIPRVGSDNSNPVWSPDETQLAFVALDSSGQSIVIHALDAPDSTPVAIDIPPHDRVWYLSWNQSAGATPPPPAAASQTIEPSTETPIADAAISTETPASLGETFTSAHYGWQCTWDPSIYHAIAIEAELVHLGPVDDDPNDWSFTVGTVDANNLFPYPKIPIVPFTPDICAGQPAVAGAWTPVHDPLTERFFRNTGTSSFQVVHGVGPVWGAAGCSVLVQGQAAVFLHATASDVVNPETLFQRLDAIIAGFQGVSF